MHLILLMFADQVARIRSLCAAPAPQQTVALGPEHRARLEASHRRRLSDLVAKACLNVVKGLMKHQVRGLGIASGPGLNVLIIKLQGLRLRAESFPGADMVPAWVLTPP